MKQLLSRLIASLLCMSSMLAQAAITPEQAKTLPAPAAHPINFSKEIKPIFEASCIKCHGRGRDKGDFQIDSRDTLLKGGGSGPAIVVGKSGESYLIKLVISFDPDNVMPKKSTKLTHEQIKLLRA
jgi:mono/diheme cytochrome c family protein